MPLSASTPLLRLSYWMRGSPAMAGPVAVVPSGQTPVGPVLLLTGRQVRLLAGHGDPEAFFGCDEVVDSVGLVADIDLHPVDPSGEVVVAGGVVGGDAGSGVAPDVGRLVAREHHRDGGFHPTLSDLAAVHVEGDGAALGEAAAVVGKLHAHLVIAGGQRAVGF